MGAARSAGGMRFKIGRKAVASDIPTAAEMREIRQQIAVKADGGHYRQNIKWFSEYERLLASPTAWPPERAAGVLDMTVRLLKQEASTQKVQKRVSTIFYCLAIIARQHGISPRAIVGVEPLGFDSLKSSKESRKAGKP